MSRGGARGGDERPVARIRLRVSPGGRRTELIGPYGDGWKLRVAAAPEHGRANAAVCDWLARLAGVDRRDVVVVTGASSRDKLVAVHGIEFTMLRGLLDAESGK